MTDTYDARKDGFDSYNVAIAAMRLELLKERCPPANRIEVVGDCVLYCGDSREILPYLNGYDTVVSDPPYGISLAPQRRITKSIANDGQDEAKALWREMLAHIYPNLPKDTAHMFWTGWSETWTKELLAEWFTVKSCVVWAKNVWGIGYYTRPQHEFAWYCHKGKPPVPGTAESDLWNVPKIQAPIHFCEKPVPLLSRCINLVGGKSIIDPFMGVGTTGVAAAKAGKAFIGIEIDPHYFQVSVDRIRKAYAQPDMFVSQPEPAPKQESFV